MSDTTLQTITIPLTRMPVIGKLCITMGFKEQVGALNKLQLSMVFGAEAAPPYTPVKPYPAAGAVAGVYVTVDANNGIEKIEGWAFPQSGLMTAQVPST